MDNIVLVGFGGHGKSVADCIERSGQFNIVGYTDIEKSDTRYNYLGTDDKLQEIYANGTLNAAVCVGYMGNGKVRQHLYSKLKQIGYNLPVIIDSSAIVSASATIDEGVFVGKGAIINAEAQIGKMAIINTKALIEHECIVGDFSHVAVGAIVCGASLIGIGSFIGAGATIIQGLIIGDEVLVGANSTVLKDLENNMKYCGIKILDNNTQSGNKIRGGVILTFIYKVNVADCHKQTVNKKDWGCVA